MPLPINTPTPQHIIQAFTTATENISVGLDKPVGFALGERFQISPNGDWVYPQAFLELPIRMEPNGRTGDTWHFSFMLLQNHELEQTQAFYTETFGSTYTLTMDLLNELHSLLKPYQLTLVDMLTIYEDFDDNCTGWRVELALATSTDRLQC